MSIFNKRVQFDTPDPLDDGTADAIAAEQREGGFVLGDEDGKSLVDFWDGVSRNLKKDPDWFEYDTE